MTFRCLRKHGVIYTRYYDVVSCLKEVDSKRGPHTLETQINTALLPCQICPCLWAQLSQLPAPKTKHQNQAYSLSIPYLGPPVQSSSVLVACSILRLFLYFWNLQLDHASLPTLVMQDWGQLFFLPSNFTCKSGQRDWELFPFNNLEFCLNSLLDFKHNYLDLTCSWIMNRPKLEIKVSTKVFIPYNT